MGFANGATGSDELASMKELAEELVMVQSVASKKMVDKGSKRRRLSWWLQEARKKKKKK